MEKELIKIGIQLFLVAIIGALVFHYGAEYFGSKPYAF